MGTARLAPPPAALEVDIIVAPADPLLDSLQLVLEVFSEFVLEILAEFVLEILAELVLEVLAPLVLKFGVLLVFEVVVVVVEVVVERNDSEELREVQTELIERVVDLTPELTLGDWLTSELEETTEADTEDWTELNEEDVEMSYTTQDRDALWIMEAPEGFCSIVGVIQH